MTIPCPVCHGTCESYDPDFGPVCTACQGSGELDLAGLDVVHNTVAKTYRWWTDDDIAELKRLLGTDMLHADIADTMGRPYGSLRNKIAELKRRGMLT
jgi:hypothetical protein